MTRDRLAERPGPNLLARLEQKTEWEQIGREQLAGADREFERVGDQPARALKKFWPPRRPRGHFFRVGTLFTAGSRKTEIVAKNCATHFKEERHCAAPRHFRSLPASLSRWLWRGCSIAVLCAGCSFDDRDPDSGQKGVANEAEPSDLGMSPCPAGAECPDDPGGVEPTGVAVGGIVTCVSDANCLPAAPTCVSGQCQCTLPAEALQADAANCGSCGYRCGSGAVCENAACKVVEPIVPGSPGTSLTAGGTEVRSPRFRAMVVTGQAPGGNAVLVSPRYRLEGGLIGTTR
jgi:hypothetical protein